jgi:hypothetical protein
MEGPTLANAIREKIPSARVEPEGDPEGDDLIVHLASEVPGWRLELKRADGTVALSRSLNPREPGCDAAAETAALILDRYLEDIEWAGRVVIGALDESPPESVQPGSPRDAAPSDRLEVSLGAGMRMSVPYEFSAGASVEATVRVLSDLRVGVWAFGGTSVSTRVATGNPSVSGSVWVQTTLAEVTGQWCFGASPISACVGPWAGVALFLAGTSGNLNQARTELATLPVVGPGAQVAYALPNHFAAVLEAAAMFPLGSARFTVENGSPAQVSTPRFDGVFSLRLGRSFF